MSAPTRSTSSGCAFWMPSCWNARLPSARISCCSTSRTFVAHSSGALRASSIVSGFFSMRCSARRTTSRPTPSRPSSRIASFSSFTCSWTPAPFSSAACSAALLSSSTLTRCGPTRFAIVRRIGRRLLRVADERSGTGTRGLDPAVLELLDQLDGLDAGAALEVGPECGLLAIDVLGDAVRAVALALQILVDAVEAGLARIGGLDDRIDIRLTLAQRVLAAVRLRLSLGEHAIGRLPRLERLAARRGLHRLHVRGGLELRRLDLGGGLRLCLLDGLARRPLALGGRRPRRHQPRHDQRHDTGAHP